MRVSGFSEPLQIIIQEAKSEFPRFSEGGTCVIFKIVADMIGIYFI